MITQINPSHSEKELCIFLKYRVYLILHLIFLTSFWLPSLGYAEGSKCTKIKLQDDGPNSVNIRKDENDEEFIDFVLALKVPVFHDGCEGTLSDVDWFFRPYFSFTGQFGFYALGDRDSSPVIGKRFNPKFFARHWINFDANSSGYLDLGYAHESNGQAINNDVDYLRKIEELRSKGQRPEFANDFISRGWDYLDLRFKYKKMTASYYTSTVYLNLKYFLDDGIFQGTPEEANSWESIDIKKREEVDGISLLIKSTKVARFSDADIKLALNITTGYNKPFHNNTFRLETTFHVRNWPPIALWYQDGFNSDLGDYYRDITSYGIGLEFRNFGL